MKSLFFSMLIITSTIYSAASDAPPAEKEHIVRWNLPEKKNLAVTESKWGIGDLPLVKAGRVVLYTDTPVSPLHHDQVVATFFIKEFLNRLIDRGRSMCITRWTVSESELVTLCSSAVSETNRCLPFQSNVQHMVKRYILAVKIGETTLLTKVGATDYDHILPLPKYFLNIPWKKDTKVYIGDTDSDDCIMIGPATPTSSKTSRRAYEHVLFPGSDDLL